MSDLMTQTVKINILGETNDIDGKLKLLQTEFSKFDLTGATQKSLDSTFARLQANIATIREKNKDGILKIGDEKEITRIFKQIQDDYQKLQSMAKDGVLTRGLKAEHAAYEEIKKQNNQLKSLINERTKKEEQLVNIKKQQEVLIAAGVRSAKAQKDAQSKLLTLEQDEKQWLEQKNALQNKANEALKGQEKLYNNLQSISDKTNLNNRFFTDNEAGRNYKAFIERTREWREEIIRLKANQDAINGQSFNQLSEQYTAVNKQVKSLKQQEEDLNKTIAANIQEYFKLLSQQGVKFEGIDTTAIHTWQEFQTVLIQTAGSEEAANKQMEQLQATLRSLGFDIDKSSGQLRTYQGEVEKTTMLSRDLEHMKMRLMQLFSIGGAVQLFRRSIQTAVNAIKELDAAMTEMAVVTDLRVGDYWEQLPKYTKQANELGVATKSVYEAATLYYQQGLKTAQVEQITTATLKMARIASLEAAEATDRMTNALRGFNMEINQTNADRIADVYSKLAAITASNVDEISTAMTKTASIASNAGMEFETTAAFLSQIIETTRESAETAGTALKTVIARFQELKKDPSEIGEIDGEIVDANKVEKALRSVGIALRDSEGQFRKLDDVFLELASQWDTLDKNTQRYIATIAAGSRQQSRFIAMMSNYEHTVELVDSAYNSAGASQEQYEKTLDSLESKLNKLHNAWNEFTMGITNSDFVKGAVDFITAILNGLNAITSGWDATSKSFLKLGAVFTMWRSGRLMFEGMAKGIKDIAAGEKGVSVLGKGLSQLTTNFFKFGRVAEAGAEGAEIAKVSIMGLNLTMGQLALAIGAIIAALYIAYKLYQRFSLEGQAKAAQKAADEASQKAAELKSKYEDLTDTIDDLSERYNAFDSLIEGTEEWNRALFETNQQVLKLLEEYPELISLIKVNNGIYTLDFNSPEFKKFQQQQQKEVIEGQQLSFLAAANSASKTLASNQNQITKGLNQSVLSSGYSTTGVFAGQTITNDQIFTESYKLAAGDPDAFINAVKGHYSIFGQEGNWAKDDQENIITEFNKAFREYQEQEGKSNLERQNQLQLVANSLVDNNDKTADLDDTMKGALKQVADGKWFEGLLNSAEDEQTALNEANEKLGNKLIALQNLFKADGEFANAFEALLTGEATQEIIDTLQTTAIANATEWKDLTEVVKDGSLPILQQLFGSVDAFRSFYAAHVVAVEQDNKQVNSTFNRLGGAQFSNETVEVRKGIATLLDNINTQVGTQISQQTGEFLNLVLNNLTKNTDKEKFTSYLNSNSWMNKDFQQIIEDLQDLGIAVQEDTPWLQTFINKLLDLADALDPRTLEDFTAQLTKQEDIYYILKNKLDSGQQTFTEDERDKLIEAGYEGLFVKVEDQYMLQEDLYAVVQDIANNMPDTVEQMQGKREEAVATGEAIAKTLNENDYNYKVLTGEEDRLTTAHALEFLKAWNLIPEETTYESVDHEVIKQMVRDAVAQYYGNEGRILEQNKSDLENGNPSDYASVSNLDLISATGTGVDDQLDKRIEKISGLNKVIDMTNSKIEIGNQEIVDQTKFLKGHYLELQKNTNAYQEFSKQVSESAKNLFDANGKLKEDDFLTMGDIAKQISDYYKTDFEIEDVQKLLPDLEKLANGTEKEAEAAGKHIGETIANSIIEAAGPDLQEKWPELLEALPELEKQLTITGVADFTDIFNNLNFTVDQLDNILSALNALGNWSITYMLQDAQGRFYTNQKAVEAAINNHILEPGATLKFAAVGGSKTGSDSVFNRNTLGGSKGKGGGSKSDKEWKNPYDWLYNKTEELNELLRERERIERRYQSLVRKRDANTLSALKLRKDETANLQKQLEIQKELEAKRYEELHKLENEAKKTGLYDYAEYDERGRVIKIDWDRIDKVKDTERGEKIEEYIKHLETLEGQFDDIEDAINSIDDDMWEMHQQAVQDYLDLENRLATALEQIDQNNLEEQQRIADSINQARDNLVNSIESNINQLRQDRENEKQEKNIAKIERRLAYLQQDTSNASQQEQLNLQEQLTDLQETYGDSLIDQSLNEMKQQNEAAAAQRDRELQLQADEIQWNHDHGIYAERAYDMIMKAAEEGFVTENSAIYQALYDGEGWFAESAQKRNELIANLIDQVAKATSALINGDVVNEETNYNDKWLEARNRYLNAKTDEERAQAAQEMTYWEHMRDEKIGLMNFHGQNKGNYQTTGSMKTNSVVSAAGATIDTTMDYMRQWKNYAERWANGEKTPAVKQGMYDAEAMRDKKIRDNNITNHKTTDSNLTDNFLRTGVVPSLDELRQYASGGMVTKTGLAWLDGTYGAPEAVLSAKDTQNFIQLRDSLRNLEGGTSIGDSYIDIDINVDQIADDYDVDQIADRIKQLIYNDATYRNVNNVNFIR